MMPGEHREDISTVLFYDFSEFLLMHAGHSKQKFAEKHNSENTTSLFPGYFYSFLYFFTLRVKKRKRPWEGGCVSVV